MLEDRISELEDQVKRLQQNVKLLGDENGRLRSYVSTLTQIAKYSLEMLQHPTRPRNWSGMSSEVPTNVYWDGSTVQLNTVWETAMILIPEPPPLPKGETVWDKITIDGNVRPA